jgi:hypothetical protein
MKIRGDRQSSQGLFPLRVAKGENFCNRAEEKRRIQNNITNIQHTLLISPRRYGKTSLALQALHESKKPHAFRNI